MTVTSKTTAPVVLPRLALTGIDADIRTVLTSSNPALVKARDAIPAFRERAQALADVLALEEKLNAQPARTTEQVVEDLIRRLGKGEPVDAADVEAAARELSSSDAISTTRRALMEHVKLEASASLSLAISGHYDAMRGHLHRTLTNVVDEVRADQLHDVRDAAAAIASSRVADHQRFNELAADYGVVRAAQFIIDKADLGPHATGGASSPTYNVARTIRGAAKAWPGYGRWALNGLPTATEADLRGHAAAHMPPWPDITGSETSFLAWLGATDTEAWVPTRRELEDEMRQLAGARRAAQLDELERAMPNKATAEARPARHRL